jgi:hypothetical protein
MPDTVTGAPEGQPALLPAGTSAAPEGSVFPLSEVAATTLSDLLRARASALRAGVNGWGNHRVLAAMALAGLLMVLFVVRELLASQPLVPAWLLASRRRMAAFLTGGPVVRVVPPVPFPLDSVHAGHTRVEPAQDGGLLGAPTGAGTMVGALIARRLAGRVPSWLIVMTGGTGLVYSSMSFTRLTALSGYARGLLPAFAACGVCIGLVLAAKTPRAVEDADRERGMASGLLGTSQQLGTSIAVAALTAAVSTSAAHFLRQWAAAHRIHPTVAILPLATTHGYTVALSATIVVAAAVVAVQALSLGRIRQPAAAAAIQPVTSGAGIADANRDGGSGRR